jgi:outer membrane receptor protein involved in Fe transport
VNVPGFIRTFTEDPSLPNPSTGAPAREGETTDFGIKVSLLKDKLFLTATSYKTTAKRDIAFSGFQVASRSKTIWQAIVDSGLLTGTELTTAQSQLQNVGAVQGYLFDSDSKGFEFEAVGELAKGWSISVNFSKTESIRTNVAPRARAYVDYWKSTWMKYKDLQVAQNTSLPGAEYKPYQDYNTPEVIAATGDFTAGTTDSVGENIVDLEKAFFDNPYVYQGTRYIGDNKYNLNVRSKYDFSSGALKGFSIGAGARLRKGRVAGAKVDYTFKTGSSYTDAYNGREINKVELVDAVDQTIYDLQLSYRRSFKIGGKKLNWSVQLNVNNLLDEDALIVNNLQAVTMAPISYRYQDPRQFVLTNTFQF